MDYLSFDLEETAERVTTLEAMVSTRSAQHAAVMAEVQRVLGWAWAHHPESHGPIDDGMAWDHDLQVVVEPDGWHRVTLTLTASPQFAEEFQAAFADCLN